MSFFDHDYSFHAKYFRIPSIESSMLVIDIIFAHMIMDEDIKSKDFFNLLPMKINPAYNFRLIKPFSPKLTKPPDELS